MLIFFFFYSMRAIEGISSCAVHLANGRVHPLSFRDSLSPPRTTASLRSTAELRILI